MSIKPLTTDIPLTNGGRSSVQGALNWPSFTGDYRFDYNINSNIWREAGAADQSKEKDSGLMEAIDRWLFFGGIGGEDKQKSTPKPEDRKPENNTFEVGFLPVILLIGGFFLWRGQQ